MISELNTSLALLRAVHSIATENAILFVLAPFAVVQVNGFG
jgi:hypothetical protein